MSGVIVDTSHVWKVLMDIGAKKNVELPLFQVTKDVFIEAGFAELLDDAASDTRDIGTPRRRRTPS